jgi:hypothetical protein
MTQLMQPNTDNGNGGVPQIFKWRGADMVVNHDDGQFSAFLDTGRFMQLYRIAEMFAQSQFVPESFRGKVGDCFIGMQMAMRLGIEPLMLLQNTYVVHGKPGIQAVVAIGLVNTSGLFKDSLDFEVVGDDPTQQNYRVRAFAARKDTGKVVHGPWIDWKIVRAEKWDDKPGSKWKTMPGLMFQYRAGSWFARLHCPERLMGMQTLDELEDVGETRQVTSRVVEDDGTMTRSQRVLANLQTRQNAEDQQTNSPAAPPTPPPSTGTPQPDAPTGGAASETTAAAPSRRRPSKSATATSPEPEPAGRERSSSPSTAPASGEGPHEQVNTDTGEVTGDQGDDAAEQQYREALQAAENALDTRTYEALKPTIKAYYAAKYPNVERAKIDAKVDEALKKHLPSTAYKVRDVKEGKALRDALALAIIENRFDLTTGEITPAAAQPAAGG